MAYSNEEDLQRLQKILAQAGIASRRKAEELILEGRVIVNGKVVTELGTKANPEIDHIKVDGRLLKKETAEHIYIALHKPDNVVSTASDPQRRTTVLDLLEGLKTRVFPVGRLDYHSTGLILLTNDGDLANAITAAKSHITKTYMVKTKGSLTQEEEDQFRRGVPLHGIRTAPAGLRMVREGDNPWYEVTLIEGRNQQIRTMFKHFGHLVEKLRRIRIGDLELGTLKPGEFRFLDPHEVKSLERLTRAPKKPSVVAAVTPPKAKKRLPAKRTSPKSTPVKRTPAKRTAAKRTPSPKRGR
ncbi:MAG: ribosomal large subunit pseudouridine synthase [Bryobacterales bacterium]|nr:ribosomal large subunit pseudouridine synthase [Bryobacterales bacterium]